MKRALSWPKKAIRTLREEGFSGLFEKFGILLQEFRFRRKKAFDKGNQNDFYDVLFINGCDFSLSHPIRYRVEHQMEQLEANGVTASSVFYHDITTDDVRRARNFIFFRCPYTETVGEFVKKAKTLNKRVYFDIDDLVIDTKYTDTIKYLATLSSEEREVYDRGVCEMGKTLQLCDAAITTTEALAKELRNYVPEVFINRNTASEEMLSYSQKALYHRDVLPSLPLKQVPRKDRTVYRKLQRMQQAAQIQPVVSIGYFSGSVTHNEDFDYILPALVKVLEERPCVKLRIVGELDLPKQLKPHIDRITATPFLSWERLPWLIAQTDINLAPLTRSIFNEAKSENKWLEASLVKVPTVASNIGAFAQMIEEGKTGFLCATTGEWYEALLALVDSVELRTRIADNAYDYCMKHCLTVNSGYPLAKYIRERQATNIAMVVPSLNTSGGILVTLKHSIILQDAGYDVFILSADDEYKWYELEGCSIPVLDRIKSLVRFDDTPIKGKIDKGVATYWDTLEFLQRYPNVERLYYLVQNYETDFFEAPNEYRLRANATYAKDVHYITISKWCERWLTESFGREVRLASNGLDTKVFWPKKRVFDGRVRILIEGDCSPHKNIDESFRIVDKLDPERFEIWYMSYMPKPKEYYRIDNFLGSVPYEKVADVYRKCHILLKTSILESFSYPPLEMMSTGGFVLALPNEGNSEYLRNEYNCLLYDQGNLDQAANAIQRISEDFELRERLYAGGLKTAIRHDWECLRQDICRLYEG